MDPDVGCSRKHEVFASARADTRCRAEARFHARGSARHTGQVGSRQSLPITFLVPDRSPCISSG
jgi:hypothetical protein